MSIQIIITDPHLTPKVELRALAEMLLSLAGQTIGTSYQAGGPAIPTLEKLHPDDKGVTGAPAIHPDDNPAKGIEVPPASQVFATGGDPAEVFVEGADPAKVFAATGGVFPFPVDGLPNGQPAAAVASSTDNAPPASVASTSLPSGAAAPAAGLDLDTEGFPWDARIHAETRTKIKVGTWKVKRGVSDDTLATVRAELRAVLGNVPPVAASPAVSAPPPNAATIPAVPAVPNGVPPPPVTGAAPSIPAAPNTVQTEAPAMSFPQLCVRITGALGSGQLTQEALGTVLAANNLQGLPTLAAFPHLVPVVAKALGYV